MVSHQRRAKSRPSGHAQCGEGRRRAYPRRPQPTCGVQDRRHALRVTGFERQAALQDAAEKLLGDDEEKRAFLRFVGDAWKLFRAVLPDPSANEFRGDMIVLQVVAEMIRTMTRKSPPKNVLEAIAEIERLIDEAISGVANVRRKLPRL
jgi:hypothetical protein